MNGNGKATAMSQAAAQTKILEMASEMGGPEKMLDILRSVLPGSHNSDDLASVLATLHEQHPSAFESAALREIATQRQPTRRDPRAGLIRACDIPKSEPVTKLWFGLYPATVTLFIGETGAGKSTALYNIVNHAARNEQLWGVDFGLNRLGKERPLNVLYVDPENSGNWDEGKSGQCGRKLDRISSYRPGNLWFHDGREFNLRSARDYQFLCETIRENEIDLCLIDPIATLFGTLDENDNAEAAKEMKLSIDLSRSTGCSVVLVHHCGRDSASNYGRGATARLAAADVGIVFRTRGGNQEEVDDDYNGETRQREEFCQMRIVKNRIEGQGSIYLRMIGEDRFERVGFEEWKAAPSANGSRKPKSVDAINEILVYLQDGAERSRTEIYEAMKQQRNIGRTSVDTAIRELVSDKYLEERVGAHNTKNLRIVPEPADPEMTDGSEYGEPPDPDPLPF